jgi:hypothetical protein
MVVLGPILMVEFCDFWLGSWRDTLGTLGRVFVGLLGYVRGSIGLGGLVGVLPRGRFV